ncbi:hypothetical protein [Brachybacterium sp. UNK5269]|uniref:hypothetical protein n=1 Tax=Brachybacterium sp. UNK5269 TaxID=3408576 RepID=UPI003BB1288E
MARSKSGPKVVVNIEQNNRIYQIIATLLLCGAIGMVAYALAKNGWLELASTMLTMFLVQLGTLLFKNGIIGLPEKQDDSAFKGTKGLLRTMAADFREWQARSPIWRLAALATAYTLGFMLARAGIGLALQVFTNVWIAGAAAAALASLIIFPSLLGNATKFLSNRATASKPAGEEKEIVTKEFDLGRE